MRLTAGSRRSEPSARAAGQGPTRRDGRYTQTVALATVQTMPVSTDGREELEVTP